MRLKRADLDSGQDETRIGQLVANRVELRPIENIVIGNCDGVQLAI